MGEELFSDMQVEDRAGAIIESFDGEGPETDDPHRAVIEGIIRGDVDPDQAAADVIRKYTHG